MLLSIMGLTLSLPSPYLYVHQASVKGLTIAHRKNMCVGTFSHQAAVDIQITLRKVPNTVMSVIKFILVRMCVFVWECVRERRLHR